MGVYVGFKIGKAKEHKAYISEYYCGRCGWPVSDHDSYCSECGGAFRKEDATVRTCTPVYRYSGEAFLHSICVTELSCGHEFRWYEHEYTPNYCPYCGAKVVN